MSRDVPVSSAPGHTCPREPRWAPGRWTWAAWALLPALAALPLAAVQGKIPVVAEDGLAESLQAGMLLVCVPVSLVVAARLADHRCRSTTLMLGVLAALALGREMDLHILVNPQNLGPWGVRYRIDWWLDRSVSAAVKALWVGIFAGIGAVLGLLAYRSAGPIDFRRARPRLMILTGVMYAAGFVFDDLLRHIVSVDMRQAVEETAELVAAAALLGAVLGPESAGPTRGEGGGQPRA